MRYLIFILILASCSKSDLEITTQHQTGVDTLPEFIVRTPLRIAISNEVPESYRGAIADAVRNWGYQLTTTNPTTIITIGDTGGAEAWAVSPSSPTVPGNLIVIKKDSRLNRSLLTNAIMHEIGHTIGLHHIYSDLSIMNRTHREWYEWSKFDLKLLAE